MQNHKTADGRPRWCPGNKSTFPSVKWCYWSPRKYAANGTTPTSSTLSKTTSLNSANTCARFGFCFGNWSHIATHLVVLVGATFVKKSKAPSLQIGLGWNSEYQYSTVVILSISIVLLFFISNTHRLTESKFLFDVILSRRRQYDISHNKVLSSCGQHPR